MIDWLFNRKLFIKRRTRLFKRGFDEGYATARRNINQDTVESAKGLFIDSVRGQMQYIPERQTFEIPQDVLINAMQILDEQEPPK